MMGDMGLVYLDRQTGQPRGLDWLEVLANPKSKKGSGRFLLACRV